jgi:flagellin-like protein
MIYFMMNRSRSGISPVVATVILVAIAIVIAIAVAFWATGLVGIFTRFEKVEIRTAYAEVQGGNQYLIHLDIANTGSADVTIDDIYINGRPSHTYQNVQFGGACQGLPNNPVSLSAGQRLAQDCTITVGMGAPFTSGTTIEVAVHTGTGKLYPAAVLLP